MWMSLLFAKYSEFLFKTIDNCVQLLHIRFNIKQLNEDEYVKPYWQESDVHRLKDIVQKGLPNLLRQLLAKLDADSSVMSTSGNCFCIPI
ncbi:hypothetical protein CD33_02950 [Ureibacillus sinduriensis BLB-1 = JCM 15800]|uniref:Uncharacterized protein n=1 Tax=Ureibacillus sinduriensis BLB-1 = JCM 15800 TaxID=1384057 RepID=A0A0A3I1T8_9BACL|nr:hypothetical protein CD33_02950 [Ureibacillus sinduriensis BLB-1 = JCM 15800]